MTDQVSGIKAGLELYGISKGKKSKNGKKRDAFSFDDPKVKLVVMSRYVPISLY